MPSKLTDREKELVQRYLDTKGATKCPLGAMSTVTEYVWQENKGPGKNNKLVLVDNVSGKEKYSSRTSMKMKNRHRGKRLRKAEENEGK